jgi:ribonuclease VapC
MVVDTSALMAIILNEAQATQCGLALESAEALLISAATVAECLIVADRRGVGNAMQALIDGLGLSVVPVSLASSKRVALAYAKWGKGVHPAGLNFSDCFAYELAIENNCPLLFVGDNFSKTDVKQLPTLR